MTIVFSVNGFSHNDVCIMIFRLSLSVCNWDIGKAKAVIAQRRLLQSPTDRSSEALDPLVVPAQGTSDTAHSGTAHPNSSYGAVSAQSFPKSADMSKNPDEETPSTADCRLIDILFLSSAFIIC